LIRALDVPDAERAWLSGDNILSDVMRYPGDVIAGRTTQQGVQTHVWISWNQQRQ